MLKNRYFISYFSTTLFYLFLGFMVFYTPSVIIRITPQEPTPKTISLSLSTFVPETVVQEEEQKEEPEPIKEKKEEVKEEVVEEPIVEEIEKEEPIVEEVPLVVAPLVVEKPKPIVVKKKVVKKPIIKKKIIKKRPVQKRIVKQQPKKRTHKTLSARQNLKNTPAQKNKFLSGIRAKINKNKSYPRMAKKRGIQGSVTVSFTILTNGRVGHITLRGSKVFYASAKSAIESAFPINPQNTPLSLPLKLNLTLTYQLR